MSNVNEDVAKVDLTRLSEKARSVFGDLVIDKQRLHASRLIQRGIPGYVAEWVLDTIVPGDGALSESDAEKVNAWAARAIPRPDDQSLIRNRLLSGETIKVLTPLQVDVILNRNKQDRIGKLSLLGISDALVPDELPARFPELLRGGMWGITELVNTEKGVIIASFKPMQSEINVRLWREARREFSLEEWRSLLLVSIGYNPNALNLEEKRLILCRLLPLIQKHAHMIELAPKGTGKSFIYENISPRVRLVSGGNISPAVLFVNNANGLPGLLARYATVVLDEVQTLKFERPEEIVGGLKGYLANGQLTRGGLHQLASDCGLVMLANILLDENQNPINDPLVRDLPSFLQETAFLDRIRGILPGWKIRKLSAASFASTLGLKTDFFGNALLAMRDELEEDQRVARDVSLRGQRVFTRNQESVRTLTSGLLKLLFPHGDYEESEFRVECLDVAVQLRQLVWDQLYQLDPEYRQFDYQIQAA